MPETPKCPYCGTEMLDDSYTWICPKCYSNSPVVIWDEEKVKGMTEEEKMAYAREAALHRAELANRPLTLDEVRAHCEDGVSAMPLWVELKRTPILSRWVIIRQAIRSNDFNELLTFVDGFGDQYNAMWRCWPRKPTPEQMQAEKWEE